MYEPAREPAVTPLVVVDADVLGRERTGDETYVHNLLRRLPAAAEGTLRLAAVTRRPELVPEGVEAVELRARCTGDGPLGQARLPSGRPAVRSRGRACLRGLGAHAARPRRALRHRRE